MTPFTDSFGAISFAPFTFEENVVICLAVITVFMALLLILDRIGVMVVKIWDFSKRRSRWAVVRRER